MSQMSTAEAERRRIIADQARIQAEEDRIEMLLLAADLGGSYQTVIDRAAGYMAFLDAAPDTRDIRNRQNCLRLAKGARAWMDHNDQILGAASAFAAFVSTGR